MRHVAGALIFGLTLSAPGCGGASPAGAGGRPLSVSIEEVRPAAEQGPGAEEIRETVRRRAAVDHNVMPPPVRDGEPQPGAWPRVIVQNDTPYGMVVWVSGPCARTLALPARAQNETEICAGEYQLAAQLAANNILPLVGAGANFEDGFRYTFTFFVREDAPRSRRR